MTDVGYFDDTAIAEVLPFTAGAGSGVGRLEKAAKARNDISEEMTEADLTKLGSDVVADWHADRDSNKEWRTKAQAALDSAAQEVPEQKDYPWRRASNVQYPLLTISAQAFHARAYAAIVKGDDAIKVKTFGRDNDGKKQARARRMAEYLNWKLFYDVEGWEQDTDSMLNTLPVVGQHYRKVWFDPVEQRPCIESVSALRLTIPADARSLRTSPRITHDFDRYPYELQPLMARGVYRKIDLTLAPTPENGVSNPSSSDDQSPRIILEQHRMMDMDDDGLDEPYIVTVDEATMQVLRIEEAFDEDDIQTDESGAIISIRRYQCFVDYGFIPDPKGRAYNIGFGHLLTPIMDVVNTTINMMLDAGHAQVAGGGFVAAELRLQGAGQNGRLTFTPGEYKTVMATGADMRTAIYERTFPAPSPVLFELLGMLMEAAKDIASVSDAITGDSARSAPVGTTLALIEQGQQVFNAIYKRIYRALREEFKLFADLLKKYGDPNEYARFCDVEPQVDPMMGHNGGPPIEGQIPADPMAQGMLPQQAATPQPIDPAKLFEEDFNSEDLDIRPVSEPAAATRMQSMARDQFALSFVKQGFYADDRLVVRQALLDAGIEQADAWIPETPPGPDPVALQMAALEAQRLDSAAKKDESAAVLNSAKASEIANNSTGAQADASIAAQVADSQLALAKAAQIASGLIAPEEAAAPVGGE